MQYDGVGRFWQEELEKEKEEEVCGHQAQAFLQQAGCWVVSEHEWCLKLRGVGVEEEDSGSCDQW